MKNEYRYHQKDFRKNSFRNFFFFVIRLLALTSSVNSEQTTSQENRKHLRSVSFPGNKANDLETGPCGMIDLQYSSLLEHQHVTINKPALRRVERKGNETSFFAQEGKIFNIIFAIALAIITLGQLAFFSFIIIYRNSHMMKINQPFLLASFAFTGAISSASCYLLVEPQNEMYCLLRDPLLFISLNLSGCILVGRAWRIKMLLLPPSLCASRKNKKNVVECTLIDVLLSLSTLLTLENLMKIIKCTYLREREEKTPRLIRQRVPLSQVLKLIFLLMIPQLILQLLNLMMPSLRSTYTSGDSLSILGWGQCCSRWPTYIGIFVAFMPFIMTFILTIKSENLPNIFNESVHAQSSLKSFLLILSSIGPSWIMSESPNQQAYFLSWIILSLYIPFQWCLLMNKILKYWEKTEESMRHVLKAEQSNFSIIALSDYNIDHHEITEVAIRAAKVFIDLGMPQMAVHSLNESLQGWKIDRSTRRTNLIGGFTRKELDFMSASDLDCVIRLSVIRCKAISTLFAADQQDGNAAKPWLDVLKVYEGAPQAASIADKSIIFPAFSGLFAFLRIGIIKDDDKSFERDMIEKFICLAETHGDPVHYLRALSMKASFLGNDQQYEDALEVVELIKSIYIMEEHSVGICESYGSDRVAQIYSRCALWEYALGQNDDAMGSCIYVLENLLPLMDRTNSFNSTELLYPILSILKLMGGREKIIHELFHAHIVQPFKEHYGEKGKTPWMPIHRPMTILLKLLVPEVDREEKEKHQLVDDANSLQEDVEWFLEEGNGELMKIFQADSLVLGWHVHTIACEACLLLAKKIEPSNRRTYSRLLSKASILAKNAVGQMIDDTGKIIIPVSYEIHTPVLREIETLTAEIKRVEDLNAFRRNEKRRRFDSKTPNSTGS